MDINKIFDALGSFFYAMPDKSVKPASGPNNLEELLQQFDWPVKTKTNQELLKHHQIQQSMYELEMQMLKMEPHVMFQGIQKWSDAQGNKYFDWVPVCVRPEVTYCCYSKN